MPKLRDRWVIKAGSQLVCEGGPLLIRAWMAQVEQLGRLHGIEVVWVTSGAIASAIERTHFRANQPTLAQKQALSAIGQPMVMDLYSLSLQAVGQLGAQVLLTAGDLANAKRRGHFQNTIEALLGWSVTPILNENDAVATEEIRFGDNDSLSARVAIALGAKRLVVLTDVEGLYESDPRQNPQAALISALDRVDAKLIAKLKRESRPSKRGTGGMVSKILAAQTAHLAGIETWLVRGDRPQVLLDVAANRAVGTRLRARPTARPSLQRKK